MKKLISILLATMIAISIYFPSQADAKTPTAASISHHFNKGYHLMSVPYKPQNPNPSSVFAGQQISKNLMRFNHPSQSYITYDEKAPREFGQIRVGEGYWFNCLLNSGCDISYDYLLNSDKGFLKINLPSPGWYLIGASDIEVSFENILVKKDNTIKKFSDVADLWVQDPLLGYDTVKGGYFSAGLKGTDNDHFLRPWQGYWLYSFEYNLKLIIPTSRISAYESAQICQNGEFADLTSNKSIKYLPINWLKGKKDINESLDCLEIIQILKGAVEK